MEFCREWDEQAEFLFSTTDKEIDYLPIVCVEHRRYIPCRACMYTAPAKVPYSDDPQEVTKVREYQLGRKET